MITAKEKILKLIDDIPEADVEEVLYFLEHIKENHCFDCEEKIKEDGEIKISYWDSDIDDEVWKEL